MRKYREWVSDWHRGCDGWMIILSLPALNLAWLQMDIYLLPNYSNKEMRKLYKFKISEQHEVERSFEDQLIAVREEWAD